MEDHGSGEGAAIDTADVDLVEEQEYLAHEG